MDRNFPVFLRLCSGASPPRQEDGKPHHTASPPPQHPQTPPPPKASQTRARPPRPKPRDGFSTRRIFHPDRELNRSPYCRSTPTALCAATPTKGQAWQSPSGGAPPRPPGPRSTPRRGAMRGRGRSRSRSRPAGTAPEDARQQGEVVSEHPRPPQAPRRGLPLTCRPRSTPSPPPHTKARRGGEPGPAAPPPSRLPPAPPEGQSAPGRGIAVPPGESPRGARGPPRRLPAALGAGGTARRSADR